jgi:GH15 family glucan-1,4-alpha-glucosidase
MSRAEAPEKIVSGAIVMPRYLSLSNGRLLVNFDQQYYPRDLLAQWYIRKAKTAADLEPAAHLIRWAASGALPCGLMAEQIHPFTGEPLSACPLT